MASDTQDNDVFHSILDLEDQYHAEGYALGVADGARSGRVEGRVFGLEEGFKRFLQMGKLSGRAAVWSARLASNAPQEEDAKSVDRCPQLKGSARLEKHIDRLSTLTNRDDFSTANDEEMVVEVDGRLKDALAKATLIAKITGEDAAALDASTAPSSAKGVSNKTLRIKHDVDSNASTARSNEMEDFAGLPQAQRSPLGS